MAVGRQRDGVLSSGGGAAECDEQRRLTRKGCRTMEATTDRNYIHPQGREGKTGCT